MNPVPGCHRRRRDPPRQEQVVQLCSQTLFRFRPLLLPPVERRRRLLLLLVGEVVDGRQQRRPLQVLQVILQMQGRQMDTCRLGFNSRDFPESTAILNFSFSRGKRPGIPGN
jgi:hypothetical protein